MGQLLVRNVDNGIIERLRTRAKRNNASLEQTVRDILSDAVQMKKSEAIAEMDRIRARQPHCNNLGSTEIIRDWRDSGGDDDDG